MTSPVALDIKDLHYTYSSDWLWKKYHVLHGITLEVHQGEAFGFLGHNGAGKTTTIKCILKLIRPTGGSIKIFGCSHEQTAARKEIGYLPEQPYFYDHLTVNEIMELYAHLLALPRQTMAASIRDTLDRLSLSARSKSPMRTLSKGLTQRVAMAQAILSKPRLLILDEPFSGLDPLGRREFRDLLVELKRGGTTIFMSSHILSDVEYLCDRASVMAAGLLKGVFNIPDIPHIANRGYELVLRNFSGVEAQMTRLGGDLSRNETFLKANFSERSSAELALKAAIEGGAEIESYQLLHGGLEELFMQTVASEKTQESG